MAHYTIHLEQMEFRAYHGCYDLEQKVGNRFEVDLEVTAEMGDAAALDAVEETVNYLELYETVRATMRTTQRTLERVAANIIGAVRERFPEVVAVRCTVRKMAPPLGGKLRAVGVTLTDPAGNA